jgi:hypothetical protein
MKFYTRQIFTLKFSSFNFLKVLFVLSISVAFATSEINAKETQISKTEYRQLLSQYLDAAFVDGNAPLRKFKRVEPLTLSFECFSDQTQECAQPIDLFKSTISQTDQLKPLYMRRQAEFHLIMVTKNRLFEIQKKLEKDFQGGISDVSETDCQLFVNLAGSTIINSVVVVSTAAEPLRIRTCLLINFYRSLGLTLSKSKNFADGLEYSSELASGNSTIDFEFLKNKVDVLMYIQSCKLLTPGMTKAAVTNALEYNSACFKMLDGGSNG